MNDNGESALHYAARIKKSDLHFPQEDSLIIQLLMEHGSDVFIQTKNVRIQWHIQKVFVERKKEGEKERYNASDE